MELCPVCAKQGELFLYLKKKKRRFMLCPICRLVFQTSESLPSSRVEQSRYNQHRNDGDDPGYTGWLERFLLKGFYPWYEGGTVLDFGSGPAPILTNLLTDKGVETVSYDKYYQPLWPKNQIFSFVILSEVLEHLKDPVKEFKKIASLCNPGTRLVLQTAFRKDNSFEWFKAWWYKEDITHIRFYNAESLQALGEQSGWSLIYQDGSSIGCFQKIL